MGSSTGDLLVDDPQALEAIFREVPHLIATHCEHEPTVRANLAAARDRFGEQVPVAEHPRIRSAEACLLSTQTALDLARRHGSRLHVLHLSTAAEALLFEAGADVRAKRITCEACVHHLWFTEADYAQRGAFIKWNPAVKTEADRAALRQALLDDRIDVLATDHAPHTRDEKSQTYFQCPSGAPMVQHALSVLYTGCRQGWIDLPTVVRKYAHAPSDLFRIVERGYLREGYWADLVLFDPEVRFTVTPESLLYKCGWSPLEGDELWGRVRITWVNGEVVYADGKPTGRRAAQALRFAPDQ
jgi:dihydroorotase